MPGGTPTVSEKVAKRSKAGEFNATLVRECYLGGPSRRKKR